MGEVEGGYMWWGEVVVACQTHNLAVVGSSPTPAKRKGRRGYRLVDNIG